MRLRLVKLAANEMESGCAFFVYPTVMSHTGTQRSYPLPNFCLARLALKQLFTCAILLASVTCSDAIGGYSPYSAIRCNIARVTAMPGAWAESV